MSKRISAAPARTKCGPPALARGMLPVFFCMTWLWCNFEMHFDCAGSHEVWVPVVGSALLLHINFHNIIVCNIFILTQSSSSSPSSSSSSSSWSSSSTWSYIILPHHHTVSSLVPDVAGIFFLLPVSFLTFPMTLAASVHKLEVWLLNFFWFYRFCKVVYYWLVGWLIDWLVDWQVRVCTLSAPYMATCMGHISGEGQWQKSNGFRGRGKRSSGRRNYRPLYLSLFSPGSSCYILCDPSWLLLAFP